MVGGEIQISPLRPTTPRKGHNQTHGSVLLCTLCGPVNSTCTSNLSAILLLETVQNKHHAQGYNGTRGLFNSRTWSVIFYDNKGRQHADEQAPGSGKESPVLEDRFPKFSSSFYKYRMLRHTQRYKASLREVCTYLPGATRVECRHVVKTDRLISCPCSLLLCAVAPGQCLLI